MNFILIYLFLINATGLLIMLIDKHNAIHGLRRIPERWLMLIALMGGSLGTLSGMYLFRHKTLHLKFSIGLPLIFAVELMVIGLILYTYFA